MRTILNITIDGIIISNTQQAILPNSVLFCTRRYFQTHFVKLLLKGTGCSVYDVLLL